MYVAVVSHTSNTLPNDVGSCLSLYTTLKKLERGDRMAYAGFFLFQIWASRIVMFQSSAFYSTHNNGLHPKNGGVRHVAHQYCVCAV